MAKGRLIAVVFLPLASMLQWPAKAEAETITTEKAACDTTTARFAARGHFPVAKVASCDFIVAEAQPNGFYVLALHGPCREDICGSTLLGWFAIEKSTGRVFEFDLEDWSPKKLVGP